MWFHFVKSRVSVQKPSPTVFLESTGKANPCLPVLLTDRTHSKTRVSTHRSCLGKIPPPFHSSSVVWFSISIFLACTQKWDIRTWWEWGSSVNCHGWLGAILAVAISFSPSAQHLPLNCIQVKVRSFLVSAAAFHCISSPLDCAHLCVARLAIWLLLRKELWSLSSSIGSRLIDPQMGLTDWRTSLSVYSSSSSCSLLPAACCPLKLISLRVSFSLTRFSRGFIPLPQPISVPATQPI